MPGEYFSHLDATGRRMDMDQRPELTKGSVEIIAPTEYMVRPPMPPIYFFLIDVSISATKSGMLEVSMFYLNIPFCNFVVHRNYCSMVSKCQLVPV